MQDFLTFRKMITPIIIQIIFWLGVVGVVITGLVMLFNGAVGNGLLMILLGPIAVRLYCELLIVFFRINDNLREINEKTGRMG